LMFNMLSAPPIDQAVNRLKVTMQDTAPYCTSLGFQ
jgi:hypothetical protein